MVNTYPTNKEIAQMLRDMAAAYTLRGVNRFRILAYDRAADAIEHATSEMKDLWDEGKLEDVPGIGKSIAASLDEWFKTGKVKHFETEMKGVPQAIFPLLTIPGFGPKRAATLVETLHLTSPETVLVDLEKKAQSGEIAKLEGFGEKSQQEILTRLTEYKQSKGKSGRMVLPQAAMIADKVLTYLRRCPEALRVEPLGSMRRMVSTIGDIDIAVASKHPEKVLEWFTNYPDTQRVIEKGTFTSSILIPGGKQVDLMVQNPASFGPLLQHFTGSKEHNIHLREYALKMGKSLSEKGIKDLKSNKMKEFSTEEDFYGALGLKWIPPEIRENSGEIELAQKNALPRLVDLNDIKGDLHIHSNYNVKTSHDLGANTIEELLKKAGDLGYQYIGISDHNPRQSNNSQRGIIADMKKRKDYFDKIKYSTKSTRVHLFIMMEIDILTDGQLALPEKAFEYLDGAIASLHSSFDQPRKQITDRVLRALADPKVKIFGHPTGRMLLKREGADLDWEKIFVFCKEHDKALEINAWPERLDLPDTLVRSAVKEGLKFVINTDSHQVEQMVNMGYGVAVARRGWAEKKNILNTLEYNNFKEWLIK